MSSSLPEPLPNGDEPSGSEPSGAEPSGSEPSGGVPSGAGDWDWLMDGDWVVDEFDESCPSGDVLQLRDVVSRPAGAWQLTGLLELDPTVLGADDAITVLQEVQRASAWLAGVETTLRAQVTQVVVAQAAEQLAADAQREQAANVERVAAGMPERASCMGFVFPEHVAYAEISAAMRWSPRTGEARILEAQELTTTWKPLLDAMLAGQVTMDHARAIGRELRHLPGYGSSDPGEHATYAKHCARILKVVVVFAATHTPGRSAKKTALLVTAADPAGARRRRRKAAERDHGVYVNPVEPGTSEIRALMPTAYAEAIHQAVQALAGDSRFETADGCITSGQRQAAALVALTLGDPGSVGQVTDPVAEAKIAVRVNVLVPIESIVGASEQGGRIGNTPVTADEVRDLLGAAALGSSTIRRLVTDATGCILDAGRSHYLASDLQKLILKLRDGTCRFPGCDRPAERCECDHATSWCAGGRTDRANLGPLCKHHHQLKTHAGWQIIASHPDGSCTWRSPLGRIYEHGPLGLVPPKPPDDPPDPEPDDDPPPF